MSNGNGNNQALAVVARTNALRESLTKKRDTIFAAAASHIKPERFIELVARACIHDPKLLDCHPITLFESAAEAARIGLEIGGVMGQAYLVPYKGEATLVLGYKGYKELAYRSDKVSVIDAGTVRPGDQFEWMRGTEQYIKHRPTDEAIADWTHCWAFAKTIHGEPIVAVMSKAQIEAHRNKFAKGWNRAGSAWMTNPEAMGRKTCLHIVSRLLPLSPEFQQLVERSEYVEHGAPLNAGFLPSGTESPSDDVDELKGELAADPFGEGLPDDGGPSDEELRREGLLL